MMPVAFLQNVGFGELLIVLAIVLLLFGAKRLPDLARSLGKSMGEFKKGKTEGEKETQTSQTPPAKNKPEDAA
jgi:sec-independent protein translocase protein TatA